MIDIKKNLDNNEDDTDNNDGTMTWIDKTLLK